ncbi:hypothetical protein ACFW88_22025 [Streptomyces anandii]|uniref:Secreted protein n=2 Tax=Streptomyces anandii TaxID=285454 RepID=A0ABW6H984_9ACTN
MAAAVAVVSGVMSAAACGQAAADTRGAVAEGGSATGDVFQANTAQDGRQNNHCSTVNGDESLTLTGGRLQGRCVTADGSHNLFSKVHYGPAHASGGNGTSRLSQENVAQRGRQNNDCADPNTLSLAATDTRIATRCGDLDRSVNEYTHSSGRGAFADGASGRNFDQENVAQEGRQNNVCDSPNYLFPDLTDSRLNVDCGNKDVSANRHSWETGGGARAIGGQAGSAEQQNIAQEGRQNNNCANPNSIFQAASVTSSAVDVRCGNKDTALTEDTLHRGGGAQAVGGALAEEQQNTAQEGRQNNNCADPNIPAFTLTDERIRTECLNKDHSRTRHSVIKGGPSLARGGSGDDVFQQNVAQEGRQNNDCGNSNNSTVTLSGERAADRCVTVDRSDTWDAAEVNRGARAEGGSAVGDVTQQNIAQSGRQNNACANDNNAGVTVTGGRRETACKTVDLSENAGTRTFNRGARAEGGSSGAALFQQNIAQEGRQNNACGNTNDTTLTLTDSRTQTQCLAADRSVNIGSQEG